jgi:hypothetical protein
MVIPRDIAQRMDEIQASKLSESEIRSRYPDVIAFVNEHVSLVDLVRASGVSLRPLSPDAPNVLVGGCPSCAGPMLVRR